jgi:hypothetical protein
VAGGSTVTITVSGQSSFDVPVDAAGNWQFTPEAVSGALSFTAETVNGFSRSGSSAFEFAPAGAGTPPQPPVTEPGPPPSVPDPAPAPVPPAAETPPAPSTVAPAGAATVVEPPAVTLPGRNPNGNLANTSLASTGADGVLTVAGAAMATIVVGGFLLVLVRRRNRHPN